MRGAARQTSRWLRELAEELDDSNDEIYNPESEEDEFLNLLWYIGQKEDVNETP